MQIEEGVIRRSRRLRRITSSEICLILHIIRKPNSIIALLFIQNISTALKIYIFFLIGFCRVHGKIARFLKTMNKHRHARHARVIFLLGGGGGGHCGSNGILCFVEKRN